MEIKDLTAILVVAMVGCVLVAGFIPVVGESVADSTTFVNTGYHRMTEYDNTAEIIAEWDYTNPNQITVNGEVLPLPSTQQQMDVNIMASESFFLRYNALSGYVYVQCYNDTYVGSYIARSDNQQNMTITISNGSAVFDNGASPKTVTYDTLYCISKDGDYILKKYNETAYILDDSKIIGCGHSAYNIDTYIVGTVEDGFTRTYRNSSNPQAEVTNYTFSDVVVNSETMDSYIGLYLFSGLNWTATNTDTGVDYPTTYSQVLVPYEVTAEKAIHADANTASIVSMIPFILIMGIVLMFVGVVLVRRYV